MSFKEILERLGKTTVGSSNRAILIVELVRKYNNAAKGGRTKEERASVYESLIKELQALLLKTGGGSDEELLLLTFIRCAKEDTAIEMKSV